LRHWLLFFDTLVCQLSVWAGESTTIHPRHLIMS